MRHIHNGGVTLGSTDLLRLERASLLARYDNGALSSAIFAVIKKLEVEIAWRQHAKLTQFAGRTPAERNATIRHLAAAQTE